MESREQGVVLLVDDYQDCREMYGAFLSMAGYRVLKAGDGVEAVQLARSAHPDIILMDLSLPGMDGLEATRLLKADTQTSGIPVVALTAQSIPTAERGGLAQFESYIIKPCLPDELADAIAQILNPRHAS
jgi:CheY-like chemotaxis protein